MNDPLLRRAAELLGIELRHTDALGVAHEASDETLSRLIAGFGMPAEPGRAVEAIAQDHGAGALGLGPVQVIAAEDRAPGLSLRLPNQTNSVEWTCCYEHGEERAGRSRLDPIDAGDPRRRRLQLPSDLPLGYHRLEVQAGGAAARVTLIVAPPSCHLPRELAPGAHSWGMTAQLYGLRSRRDWGIGDFTGLAAVGRGVGGLGAAVLGINPLHALFAAEPRHVSPYSPSSRAHLDYLYIDVEAVPGYAEDAAARALISPQALAAARAAPFVDYAAVAALKRPVLEALYHSFRERDFDASGAPLTASGEAFRGFQEARGSSLAAFATFEALHEHYSREPGMFSWRAWPAPFRDPRSAAVAEFAAAHRERIGFFQFLQWEADRQLGAAAVTAREGGLSLGLYRDLAVGVDPNGAEAWADQELVAPGAAIGAPPDPLSRAGQNWGLAPFNPVVLRRHGFLPFVTSLRANMRHAGVLRIDHVMSLKRLYWIPNGAAATEGAYVNYPFDELLRVVALESRRHECAVIGEDLGTVPEGFRETMQAANVLSYRIVGFERREDRRLVPPAEYPPLAAASAATHDIATLKGFWLGRDIDWRQRLKLYPDAQAEATETAERRRDRQLLLEALSEEGLIAPERFPEFLSAAGDPSYSAELGDAILAFLARSRSRLMLVQLEDVAGEAEQANLPGTTDAHPNWKRRMSVRIEEILAGPELRRVVAVVAQGRKSATPEAAAG
ncbi:MAG: 4-alpha-glucanotransferase [Alphaproteobacteria bacterium]|nr:4-alpha-glucanotransferase [Alphaproteobacteria bacterium]